MDDWPVTSWTAIVCGVLCIVLTTFVTWKAHKVEKRKNDPWLLRVALLPLVLAVIFGIVTFYSLLLRFAFGAKDFALPESAGVTSPVLVGATLIAGTLTAAYAVLRLRAHLLAEARGRLDVVEDERANEKHRADREAALIERFAKAVALLADDHAISRIAGAHLVLSLGDEWSNGTRRCFDVLTSHLRGLNEQIDSDDRVLQAARGVHEEVRLITTELLRRLSSSETSWCVTSGDFQGVILGDADFTGVRSLKELDLTQSRVLGDLRLPAEITAASPRLSGLTCSGDIEIQWNQSWEDLDMRGSVVRGSLTVYGKSLGGSFTAHDLEVIGDVVLSFEEFAADVLMDNAEISGEIQIGSKRLRSRFGSDSKQTSLSLVESSFAGLKLQHSRPGPRLDLTEATGSVDLSYSWFPFKVTANQLHASSGFTLKRTRFDDELVLDRAELAQEMDLEGMRLSERARSAIESSDFVLKERFVAVRDQPAPLLKRTAVLEVEEPEFDWPSALASINQQISPSFASRIEERLMDIDKNLPVDWQNKESFLSSIMTRVARAAAQTNASDEDARRVKAALRTLFEADL